MAVEVIGNGLGFLNYLPVRYNQYNDLPYFTISEDTELTEELLLKYIDKFRQNCLWYQQFRDAYSANYKILHLPAKPKYKPDERVVANYVKNLVDTFNGFFIGEPIKQSSDDEQVSAYLELLDKYNMQDDNNSEISKMCDIYGRAYEFYFVDEDGFININNMTPMESFMIYSDGIHPVQRYFVHVYKDSNGVLCGSISDETNVRWFKVEGTLKFSEDVRPHGFKGVPAVEYCENEERLGLAQSVMTLIDAYNKALSEKSNDVDYFSDCYLAILGALVEDEDVKHIRDNRIINFAGEEGSKVVAQFLTKPSNDETQENLLNRLENLIFQISGVANINDDKFGTYSGIAIKYRMFPMNNLAKTKERKFTKALYQRYRIIFSNPMAEVPSLSWININFSFTRNFPDNLSDEADTVVKLKDILSRKTLLGMLSCVDNVDDELARIKGEESSKPAPSEGTPEINQSLPPENNENQNNGFQSENNDLNS